MKKGTKVTKGTSVMAGVLVMAVLAGCRFV